MNFALELFLSSLALIYFIVIVSVVLYRLQSFVKRKR